MEIIQKLRMKNNTRHLEITALNNSIEELNKNIIKLIKILDKKSKNK